MDIRFFTLADAESWFQIEAKIQKQLANASSKLTEEGHSTKDIEFFSKMEQHSIYLLSSEVLPIDRIIYLLKHLTYSTEYFIMKYDLIKNETDVIIQVVRKETQTW